MITVKGMDDSKRLAYCKEYLNSDFTKYAFESRNNLAHGSIRSWLCIFGIDDKSIYIPMDTLKNNDVEELRKKNEELQLELAQMKRRLEYAEMGRDAYDCMIDIAEKQFKIQIRKKPEAK